MTYTTTKVKFEKLNAKLRRLFKKLDAIGAGYKFEVLNTFVRRVPVYAVDDINKCQVKVDETNVECVEFEIEFDKYVVGNYRVGAVVEKTAKENENLVYTVDDTVDFTTYRTGNIRCDHCNRNHRRVKAVVLVDNTNGEHKMVGTACLKDFIGYSVETFAGYFEDIQSILLENEEPYMYDYERGAYKECVDARAYLAYCIEMTIKGGYAKTIKEEALVKMRKGAPIDERFFKEADETIKFFESYNGIKNDGWLDDFENNTRIFVTGRQPVSGENGIIAYAYTLRKKIEEKMNEINQRKVQAEKSGFVGAIGDKITITAKPFAITSFETNWGCTTIYKFVDENDNIYIWKTSGTIEGYDKNGYCVYAQDMENVTIKGTIKEHSTYNGECQTVLTRCKVVGFTLKESVVA